MKAKNGVRIKMNRNEIGNSFYINDNPGKMSIADYNLIAEHKKSIVDNVKRAT